MGLLVYHAPFSHDEGQGASMAEINAIRQQIKELQGRLDDLRGYL